MMTLATESVDRFVSVFAEYQANGAERHPSWLKKLRHSAIASFQELGFPTTRQEEWKYTSIDPILAHAYLRGQGDGTTVSAEDMFWRSFAESARNRLVFVNGLFNASLSTMEKLPAGVRVVSVAQAIKEDDEALEAHLASQASHQKEAFVALNTAFIEDGAMLVVPEGCRIEEPIFFIFVFAAAESPAMSHPRNLILLQAGSDAQIVESYLGLGPGAFFVNAVTELVAGAESMVHHYRLQPQGEGVFHVGTLAARIERNANFFAHALTLGGLLVRNNVHVVLDGEGSQCTLNGLYLIDGRQHVDNFTEIEHVKPRATSLELYKGVVSGHGKGVFNGKILVHKDAQKTNARQTNKNLLLSEHAVVNTKPQLEIRADDVKCSHGSTIGQLDRDALFYFRSRGIGLTEAQSLLCTAFASEVVQRVKIPALRARLDDYLLTQFAKEKARGLP